MSLISHCKTLSQSKHSCMSFFFFSEFFKLLYSSVWGMDSRTGGCTALFHGNALALYSPITWTFRLSRRLKLSGVHVVCVLALSDHHLEPISQLSGQSSHERGVLQRKEEKELACKLCLWTGRAQYWCQIPEVMRDAYPLVNRLDVFIFLFFYWWVVKLNNLITSVQILSEWMACVKFLAFFVMLFLRNAERPKKGMQKL